MKLFRRRGPRPDLRLVVGLGNPGKHYESSRHNVGFLVADHWARRHRIQISRKRTWALVGEGEVVVNGAAFRALVAKPRSYMNRSGEAVHEMVKRHHIDPAKLIVIYDDMDLPLGKLRLREKGSPGGHKGVASIIGSLGTDEFPRMRIGIGRPESADAIDYVLGDFQPAEMEAVERAVARATEAIDWILAKGMASAMNEFNTG